MQMCTFDDVVIEKYSKNELMKSLEKNELLSYGSQISQEDIENIFNTRKDNETEKNWNFLVLRLMNLLTSEGFFSTSRGLDGGIYILLPEEMPGHNESKNKLAYKDLTRRQKSLYLIDQTILEENQKRKLEFEILKNGHMQLEMFKSLRSSL